MTDKPLLPILIDKYALTITIVGTFTKGKFDPRLDLLMDRIKQALDETMPDFVPAWPPAAISHAQLAVSDEASSS